MCPMVHDKQDYVTHQCDDSRHENEGVAVSELVGEDSDDHGKTKSYSRRWDEDCGPSLG